MFTLKFIKYDNQGRAVSEYISCTVFKVTECNDGYIISTHNSQCTYDSIDREVNQHNFWHCYVENIKGKTIAHYRAKGFSTKPSTVGKFGEPTKG